MTRESNSSMLRLRGTKGCVSGHNDGRKEFWRTAVGLCQHSKKGTGLPRVWVSTLCPKPDEEELRWEEWQQIWGVNSASEVGELSYDIFAKAGTFHSRSHRWTSPICWWNRCWSAVWLQPPCTLSYREHTSTSWWCWGPTGGTDGVDCPTTKKSYEEHWRRKLAQLISESQHLKIF